MTGNHAAETFRSPETAPEERARRLIEASAGREVDVRFHDNRVTLASVRAAPEGWRVRLHAAFRSAPESVLQHLGMFLRTRKSSWWRAVRAYAAGIVPARAEIEASPVRPHRETPIRTRGDHFDLQAILAEVAATEFEGRHAGVRITWGRAAGARRARRRSIRFGSFDTELNLIRIHPSLDHAEVPAAFMRFLIFHELLHAEFPPRRSGGRWIHHPRELRHRERLYPGYKEMKAVMTRLMRAAP